MVEGDVARSVYLSIGSNVGDRLVHLRGALDALEAGGVSVDAVSAVYETPPWGVEDQPYFANIAASGSSTLSPHALLALAKRIEAAEGRAFDTPRWDARPLDIDLVLIEGETVDTPDLRVPHPLMHERGFVLVPLAEIAPVALHPTLERSVEELCDALPEAERAGISVLAPRGWCRV